MASFSVWGDAQSTEFAHCVRLAELATASVGEGDFQCQTNAVAAAEWPERRSELISSLDAGDAASAAELATAPVVVVAGTRRLLGGEWSFAEELSTRYGVRLDLNPQQLEQFRLKHASAAASIQEQGAVASKVGAGKRCLLLVDIQNDFCPGGSLAVPDGADVVEVVNRLRQSCAWDLVVLTQDWHPQDHVSFASNHPGHEPFEKITLESGEEQTLWPDHCVQGSRGAEFHPALERAESDVVVRKGKLRGVDSYSGFGDASEGHANEKTELEAVLQEAGIEHVFICGLASDVCVSFTAQDAAKVEGLTAWVVEDGCRGLGPDSVAAEFAKCKEAGVEFLQSAGVPREAAAPAAASGGGAVEAAQG